MSVPMFISRRAQSVEPSAHEVAVRRAMLIFRVNRADLLGPSRASHLCRARDWLATELRAMGWSLPRIGAFVGRHHTAVIAMLRREAARRAEGGAA